MAVAPVDPVWVWIARLSVALLFAAAGASKLRFSGTFREAVAGYALLPRAVVPAAALGLATMELAAALLLVLPTTGWWGALLLWAMLLLFSAAIGFNMLRGRTEIDCGCWLFGARPGLQKRIGMSTLARNAGLALLILVAVLPVQARPFGVLDWVTVLAGTLAALGLFAIATETSANARLLAGLRTARP